MGLVLVCYLDYNNGLRKILFTEKNFLTRETSHQFTLKIFPLFHQMAEMFLAVDDDSAHLVRLEAY